MIARWLVPLGLPLWGKGALAMLLLLASQFHFWNRLSSGSVFAPEFPRGVVLLLNWAFGAILLLAVLQILVDLGALTAALLHRSMVTIPDGVRFGAAGLAAVLAAIGVANAVRVPPVRDVAVAIPGLPPAFEGYRLLQLTDLHLSRLFPAPWARAVVERANAAGADLIVVTGDFIDGSVAMRRDDVAPLRDLRAPDGVWAIPGNHEYFFDYPAWMRHLAGLGLKMLPNAHTVLARGEGRLVLAGVTDASAPASGEAGPDLAAALAGAPPGAPVVLLDHQPRGAKRAAARGVALQLSGHTHGGMILGLDRLVARGNNGFVSGRYDVGGMILYVGNGTGIWPGFALRLGRPAEMTRFTLHAAPRADEPG
ncbi:3',5'-cyclic adenosine monophosphate phosphodiesterase CpdA [Methylobacterium frigidaeris]|uniref:3',5'-cyclic adenosine monophosphate phosphodiesterase CpdA n=1 Tax=Methylobacterium frigidaeris TaxID=2038277 RepID=A0AA37M670_9HYPH|nr:3',5'-cyclic adenosine monophosphate phosphodiesterase CpdA [Methylobacterium frigidaeris]